MSWTPYALARIARDVARGRSQPLTATQRYVPDSPGWQAAAMHSPNCWCQQCKAERDFVRSGIVR